MTDLYTELLQENSELEAKILHLEQENETLKRWLSGKEKQLQENIDCIKRKKDEIKTLRYMLYEEKEIPKDKFVMMYRISQNERKTRQHRDLCINLVRKYKSALEEIKEIAKCRVENLIILDKCNEVLNGNS